MPPTPVREIKRIVLFRLQSQSKAALRLASNLPGYCPDLERLWVTACPEGRTCRTTDTMGQKSWDWGGGGGGREDLANQAPGLSVFQVLRNKTNSINMKPELQLVTDWWWYQFVKILGLKAGTWNCSLWSLTLPGTFSQLRLQMFCDNQLHCVSLDVG